MGATKMHFYTDHQIEMANLFKALGHPARISIMEKLLEGERYNCSEIQMQIGLAPSTISRHLKELFSAGLIGYKMLASSSFYYISRKAIKEIVQYLIGIHCIIKDFELSEFVYFKPGIKHNLPYFMRI